MKQRLKRTKEEKMFITSKKTVRKALEKTMEMELDDNEQLDTGDNGVGTPSSHKYESSNEMRQLVDLVEVTVTQPREKDNQSTVHDFCNDTDKDNIIRERDEAQRIVSELMLKDKLNEEKIAELSNENEELKRRIHHKVCIKLTVITSYLCSISIPLLVVAL